MSATCGDNYRFRSLLFVPAHQRRLVDSAARRSADGVILDLEDSVPLNRKDVARSVLGKEVQFLTEAGHPVLVRINSAPQEALLGDVEMAVEAGVLAIILPKAETARQVVAASTLVRDMETRFARPQGQIGLVPTIETPKGVLAAEQIAASDPRVKALIFGPEDFAAALGLEADETEMTHPAQSVALAGHARSIPVLGLPGTIAIVDDPQRFGILARRARSLGFTGSPCIHPSQIQVLNCVFGVDVEELASATAICQAYEDAMARGDGAISFQGRMIDEPIYRRAKALVTRAVEERSTGSRAPVGYE